MRFTHDLLPTIDLVQENGPNGRYYVTPNGKRYPSMTTILGIGPKPELDAWRERVGEEEAERVSRRACKRGEIFHGYAEEYLNNRVPNVSMFDLDGWKRYQPVLDRINNIRLLEGRLYSDKLKISGTADCIAEWDKELATIDHKSSARLKTEEEIQDYCIQATGYSCMAFERFGLKIKKIVILISVDNENPQIFVKNVADYLDPLFKKIECYYGLKRISK